ncbi:hypothetical protein AB835_13465 [Candidatus Endobugula sertula]|uniref:EamA domain-containing protein n=1 Tax=Candidatus Endobugula sertula TaxID=62101 RepID=A0A1D2QLW2_9GAMM|nr:hypothetical protein AB835_13465 [Candidatus Endobugula sertula]
MHLLFIVAPNSLFGVGLIGEEVSQGFSWLALSVAIMGAFGSAVAYVLIRELNKTEDTSVIIFYFPIVVLPLSLVLLRNNFVMLQGETWFVLLMIGLCTHIGQVGLTKAMQTESAGRATSFSYLQVVFAVVFGVVFFAEIPTIWTLFGACFMITGVLINVVFAEKNK